MSYIDLHNIFIWNNSLYSIENSKEVAGMKLTFDIANKPQIIANTLKSLKIYNHKTEVVYEWDENEEGLLLIEYHDTVGERTYCFYHGAGDSTILVTLEIIRKLEGNLEKLKQGEIIPVNMGLKPYEDITWKIISDVSKYFIVKHGISINAFMEGDTIYFRKKEKENPILDNIAFALGRLRKEEEEREA